jgi:hypothetical protein
MTGGDSDKSASVTGQRVTVDCATDSMLDSTRAAGKSGFKTRDSTPDGGGVETEKHEFWVRCPKCVHAWVAAYTPMPIEAFIKIGKHIVCPKCGDTKGLLCGKGETK